MALLSENLGLIFGLAGAAIALGISLTERISQKPSRRLLSLLAVLGFLAFATQQLITTSLDKQSKILKSNRAEIIAEIRGTVHRTEDIVTELNSRLSDSAISDLGDRLVTVESDRAREAVEVLSYGKGDVQAWNSYARWVKANRAAAGRQLCLTFDVNAGRHYRVGLILAYLFTAPETESQVRKILQEGAWETFDEQPLVDRFLLDWRGVTCVLFHKGTSGPIIAYASARDFALEILLQQRVGQGASLEQLLNEPRGDIERALSNGLSSVKMSIVRTSQVEAVVQAMIEEKWPECVAETSVGHFLVSLERVVRAARSPT